MERIVHGKPGGPKIEWKRCGYAYVAYVGPLRMVVRKRGRRGIDEQWLIDHVFGRRVPSSEWSDDLDQVLRLAEAEARKIARTFAADAIVAAWLGQRTRS